MVMMIVVAHIVRVRQIQSGVIHVTIRTIALTRSQHDQTKQTRGHLEHSCQVVIVVDWQ